MTAPRDPSSPDIPEAVASASARPMAGPTDLAVALLVAARKGDPGAFARFVEQGDVHVRPFVHLTLAGDGSTDRVLAAAYVRAYRALPRYRLGQSPALWLHRVAYLAAIDELRLLGRDPMRRPSRAHPAPPPPNPDSASAEPMELAVALQALRHLAPDQRALATMVDLEGFPAAAVADAFGTAPEVVGARLASARRMLATAVTEAGHGADGTGDTAWAEAQRAGLVHRILADVAVPAAGATFWDDLGRRLLAERDRPAAPPPDPAARLARAHPAEPGYHPGRSGGPAAGAVSTLADRAHHNRPRRRWRPSLTVGAVVVAVAALVAGAVALGLSGRTPDGSATGTELADALAAAMSASRYLAVDATVDLPAAGGATTSQRYRLTLGDDGSWAAARTDAFDRATFDGSIGLSRRVVAVPASTGRRAKVLAAEDGGLAAGAPDPTAVPPEFFGDLRAVGTLLRSDGDRRATAAGEGDERTWTYRRTVATGPDGTSEEWRVTIAQVSGLPVRIERRRTGTVVRRVRFAGWEPASEVPDDTFRPSLPEPDLSPDTTSTVTTNGFVATNLAAVAVLGRGEAVTPSWLPEGFELAAVALRDEALAGTPSTGGGTNPPDVAVTSLGFQRGPERITVTTRATTAPAGDWTDPFVGEPGADTPRTTVRRTLGDGRYNQVPVQVGVDPLGRAHVWGIDDDTVFTVGGDLTAADAYRVAASLR